jgi:flagellar protein FliO/FliZ
MLISGLQAVFALAVTLGLFGIGVYALRRFGPQGLFKFTPQTERRLAIVESLTLDANRRLVLVRVDRQERLLLLGEGRLIETGAALSTPASASDPLRTSPARASHA